MLTVLLVFLLVLFVIARVFSLHWNLALLIQIFALVIFVLMTAYLLSVGQIHWPGFFRPQINLLAFLKIFPWIAMSLAIHMAIVRVQFSSADLLLVRSATWSTGLLSAYFTLVYWPKPSWVDLVIVILIGLLFTWDLLRANTSPAEPIKIGNLFAKPAVVFQGGNSILMNHHFLVPTQRYAVDLVMPLPKSANYTEIKKLTEHPCFGEPVLAPFDCQVIQAIDGLPDVEIGEVGESLAGNMLILKRSASEDGRSDIYAMLAHLKNGSVNVQEGDLVSRGAPVAECGNSGNTTAPHLHFQLQNEPEFSNESVSLKTYPISFESVIRGTRRLRGSVFVRRNDIIEP